MKKKIMRRRNKEKSRIKNKLNENQEENCKRKMSIRRKSGPTIKKTKDQIKKKLNENQGSK